MTSGWGWPSRRRGRGERPSSVLTDTPGKNLNDDNNFDTDLSDEEATARGASTGGARASASLSPTGSPGRRRGTRAQADQLQEPMRSGDTVRWHNQLDPPQPLPPPPPDQYPHCQAGTSAALLPDRTALIGTPGPHTWRGTVFAVSTSDVSIPPTFCPG